MAVSDGERQLQRWEDSEVELMPLADDARRLLRMRAEAGAPHIDQLTPDEARQAVARASALTAFDTQEVGSVHDFEIEGPGGPLRMRSYNPPVVAEMATPALLFFHGGGWVTGSLDTHDGMCRRLCLELGFPVFAVDYRLAPEHPFPAAIEDAFCAARWLAARAAELGVDAGRLVIGGDSAGGNLAAVAAIAAAGGELPAFTYQLLFYPVTDLAQESAGYDRVADGVPISGRTMRWFRDAYIPNPSDRLDWRASPLRAASVAKVAPAFVITARHDPLAEEGGKYVARLVDAGIEVTHLHYSHQLHAFLGMGRLMREASAGLASAAAAVRAHLTAVTP